MKTNQWIVMAGASIMCLAADTVLAQPSGGFAGGNFANIEFGGFGSGSLGGVASVDPAQQMDQLRAQLGIAEDIEWDVLQPLIQKVTDARTVVDGDVVRASGMTGRSGRSGNFGGGGGFGAMTGQSGAATRSDAFGGTTSQELQAVQRAVEGNASKENTETVLVRLAQVRKDHRTALAKAQDDLRKVVTIRQEAVLVVNGYL